MLVKRLTILNHGTCITESNISVNREKPSFLLAWWKITDKPGTEARMTHATMD